MFCNKCGTAVRKGDEICHICGAQLSDNAVSSRQLILQRENNKQYRYKQQRKDKNIRALWISLSGVLIIAAVIIVLLIYPGLLVTKENLTVSEDSVKSIQTRFLLENINVIKKAFEGFGSDTVDKLLNEPFDLSLDITATVSGFKLGSNINIAYDNKTMGFNVQSQDESIKAILLKKIFYIQEKNSVIGMEFNTDSDLQQSMPLAKRIFALEGDSNKNNAENYGTLTNLLLNDIDEKSFTENDSEKVLTLNSNDIINILQKFSGALKDNEKYKSAADGYLKAVGITGDSVEVIDETINKLKASDKQNELIWKVLYKDGMPTSISITYGEEFDINFGYENNGSGNHISFILKTGTGLNLTGDITYRKTADGINYNGTFTIAGNSAIFVGNEKWNGDKTHGILDITINGQILKLEYDEILKFGMPLIAVDDDSRFKINTDNAKIINISDIPTGYGAQNYNNQFGNQMN